MKDASAHDLVSQIKTDLIQAMKDRKSLEVSTLRSLLASIANAEAVPVPGGPAPTGTPIAQASIGVGSTEAARKQLSHEDIQAIIQAEIQEIQTAQQHVATPSQYTAELSQKLAILQTY